MHQVAPSIGEAFILVEQVMQETFIQDLLRVLGEGTLWRGVTFLPVKKSVLELPDPTKMTPDNVRRPVLSQYAS